jgi:hypothetical protein
VLILQDYPQLLEALERAYPAHREVLWEIHSPTSVSTVVITADGLGVQCRWSFGASLRWSLIIALPTSADS